MILTQVDQPSPPKALNHEVSSPVIVKEEDDVAEPVSRAPDLILSSS